MQLTPKSCEFVPCGTVFTPTVPTARFCSTKCRTQFHLLRKYQLTEEEIQQASVNPETGKPSLLQLTDFLRKKGLIRY